MQFTKTNHPTVTRGNQIPAYWLGRPRAFWIERINRPAPRK